MKLNKVLLIAAFSGFALISCKNNEREMDDVNCVEIEDERGEDLNTRQQGLNDENGVTARVLRNQNLSTFNEGWTRNQVNKDLNRASTSTGTTSEQTNNQGMAGQRSYTIFAPTNEAYAGLTETERNDWKKIQNRDKNIASINYLMVDQKITQVQLRQQIQSSNGAYTIKTMQGQNIATLDGNNIVLRDASENQARIVESDAEGTNGVIHIIDKVLRPKNASRNDAKIETTTGTTTTGTTTTKTKNQ